MIVKPESEVDASLSLNSNKSFGSSRFPEIEFERDKYFSQSRLDKLKFTSLDRYFKDGVTKTLFFNKYFSNFYLNPYFVTSYDKKKFIFFQLTSIILFSDWNNVK